MHSPTNTQSAPLVVRESHRSKACYEGGILHKAMVGLGKTWIKDEVGTGKLV